MFSLFESILQEGLSCPSGFNEAKKILTQRGNTRLYDRFKVFFWAINVLKHGRGRSYEALVATAGSLPFRIKLSGEAFFYEGDVSEILTLIDVDDKFVLDCAQLIEEISKEVRLARPDCFV